jgi:uncharacterized protein (DUF1778 family)
MADKVDSRNRVSITLSDQEYALLTSVAAQMGLKLTQLVHNATFEAVPHMYNRFSATLDSARKAQSMMEKDSASKPFNPVPRKKRKK